MNKPGSHRGAHTSKKKKYKNNKQEAISLTERVRKFLTDERKRINNLILDGSTEYFSNSFRCTKLAMQFKVKIGDIVRVAKELEKETLITTNFSSSGMYINLNGIRERNKKENKEIVYYFNYKKCPICESELTNKFDQYIISRTMSCDNECFYYYASVFGNHETKIFDKKFIIPHGSHVSVCNQVVGEVKKEIVKMKKGYKYLAEILERR